MYNTAVALFVIDKRSQLLQPQEVSLDMMGTAGPLPKDFPRDLNTLYRRVQNLLRWEEVSPEYRFIPDPAFDVFSFVPQELKDQDFQGGQPALLKDCCRFLGAAGEILLKVQRREVLYLHTCDGESTETVLQEGISVRDAMRQCVDDTIYAVLYCQYLYGQLTAVILHIDRSGKALRLPE